ncbi:TonB family protein [Thalassotalea fusca]
MAAVLKLILSLTSYQKTRQRYAWAMLAMMTNLFIPIATFYYIYTPDYTQLVNTPFPLSFDSDGIAAINGKEVLASINLLEILPYVSVGWMTVVLCLSAKLLMELYSVNRLPKSHVLPVNEELQQRFDDLVRQIGLSKAPTLLISMKSQVPMVIGWLKPVVLLPAAMLTGLTPSQLDMLLLHELAHVRRHDYLVNFIQTLVEILLFFHPAVRWVSKQMRNEREYCSDDMAVSVCQKPLAYARALTETASVCHVHQRRHSIPSMAMAASGGDLKKRVIRLVDAEPHCSSNEESGKWMASLFIVFAISLVLFKPLMSFTVFDLTAGQFSIFRITNDTDFNQFIAPVEPVELTDSSIVSYYLDEPSEESKELQTPAIVKNTTNDLPKDETYAKVTPTESTTVKTASHAPVAEAPIVASVESQRPQLTLEEPSQRILVSQQVDVEQKSSTTEVVAKNAMQTKATPRKASPVEQAFARTDSKDKSAKNANPYAETIADLAKADMPTTAIEYDFKKFESATTVNQPLLKLEEDTFTSKPSITSKKDNSKPSIKTNAVLLRSIEPRYPSSAKRKGIELDVLVEFTVDKYGKVSDVLFEEKSKVHFFRGAIKKAIEKWRFQPAKKNGKPVETTITKIFSFSLSD